MRNSLADLNAYLFEELDRITNEDLSEQQLQLEITRAKAITDVAEAVTQSAQLQLDVMKHLDEYGYNPSGHDKLLELSGGVE